MKIKSYHYIWCPLILSDSEMGKSLPKCRTCIPPHLLCYFSSCSPTLAKLVFWLFFPFLWDWLALLYFRAFTLSVPSSWSILILKLRMIHFSLPFSSLLKLICQKKPYLTPSKIMEPLSLYHSLSTQLGSCFFFINFSKYIDFIANHLLIVWCISKYKVYEERNLALS